MRSARMILATAAASAALALSAPGAYASGGGEGGHDDSSYSSEHGYDSSHDEPRGGMHTGGGALAAVMSKDWISDSDSDNSKFDPETYKDDDDSDGEDSGSGRDKDSWSEDEDKPSGGMHTGGGALANPGVTAGGLAVVAFLGTGIYALRRRNAADSAS